MFPTQDPRPISSAQDGDAPTGNELTTAGPSSPVAESDVNSVGRTTGSSAKPSVVIIGGSSEISLIGPTGLPLADEKTVISKRPLGPETPTPTPSRGSSTKSIGESLIGCQLDHYELVEFVGGGGMGSVFRARDTRLGREVAVKVLARDQTDDETIRRFRNEAQSAARLDHPNIARVHFVGESGGWNYIVFEFIEGINLRDLVQRDGPLPLEDALRFTNAVAEALEHAWQREVVHRDIKPSNLLVTYGGALKLVDMGLARMQQVDSSSDDLTASGVTLGTFDYISPEQARDPRMADVRSDIYSLGCTLFFLLTGQPPFPEGTALQKLLSHSQEDPPDVRSFRPELSPKVTALLHKMLAKRPAHRQQSPADVMHDLAQLAEPLGVRLATNHRAKLPSAEPSLAARVLPILVPALTLLIAIIVVDRLWPTVDSTAIAELPPIRLQPAATNVSEPTIRVKPVGTSINHEGKKNGKPVENSTNTSDSPASESTDESVVANTSPEVNSAESSTEKSVGTRGVPLTLTKIVVRPKPATDEPADPGVVYSLERAIELAKTSPKTVLAIELAYDGETLTRPIDLAPTTLTIGAANGYSPVITFRPEIGSSLESQRMIRVEGLKNAFLHIKGIEFRLEMPSEGSSMAWTLFSIGQLNVLTFDQCVLTIANVDASGSPLHYPVSALEMQPPRRSETMMEAARDAMVDHTTLQLTKCVVRGEADFIRFVEERPCQIVWNQGLLATTEHLMTSTGVTEEAPAGRSITVDLANVTLAVQKGIYHLFRRDDAAYQLGIDLNLTKCNVANSPESAWFEFDNGPGPKQLPVRLTGSDNRYSRPNLLFARVRPKGETATEITLEEARQNLIQNFGQSTATLRGWETPAEANVPVHLHTKENYIPSGSFTTQTGFALDSLPPSKPASKKADAADGESPANEANAD